MSIHSEEVDILEALFNLCKSKVKLAIVDLLLSVDRPLTVKEISSLLKINANTVSVTLHYLNKQNIVDRVQRGSYRVKVNTLLRAILPIITSDIFKQFIREYKSKLGGGSEL